MGALFVLTLVVLAFASTSINAFAASNQSYYCPAPLNLKQAADGSFGCYDPTVNGDPFVEPAFPGN
jgi:hypothetical protein